MKHEKTAILAAFEKLGLTSHPRLSQGDLTRELIITPFQGARGTAGFVFALNGTPPQILTVITPSGSVVANQADIQLVDLTGSRVTTIYRSPKAAAASNAYELLRDVFNEMRWSNETLTL